jgi:DNA primase
MTPACNVRTNLDIRRIWLAVFGDDPAASRKIGHDQHRVICPWHNESRPSCDISFAKNVFCCRSCGAAGGALSVVTRAGYADTNAEAVQWLRDHGVSL